MLCELPRVRRRRNWNQVGFSTQRIESRMGFQPIVHTTAGLAEAGPLFGFHLRHTSDTESVVFSNPKPGLSAPSNLYAQSVPNTSWFPHLSYILSQISPFLNFSRKQEYIREAEVEKKYRSVHIRHPPCHHTFTDMPSVTSQISSTIFALNFQTRRRGIQEDGDWPKEDSSLAMQG